MRLNSLSFRLLAVAGVWTFLVLPLVGLLIYSLYRQDIESSFNDRLRTLLTVVLADSVDHAGPEPAAPQNIGEPLFEIPNSGWYWQIKPVDGAPGARLASTSLGTTELPSPYELKGRLDAYGVRWLDTVGPQGQPVRLAETDFAVGYDESGPRYAFAVAGPLDWLEARVSSFRWRIAAVFAIVGLGLVAVSLFQVQFALRPLRAIGRGLAAIRSGEAQRLDGDLPAEIEPLQVELNALIQSNQDIVDRARTQVGNLAHALKTPLAVITNESREDTSPFGAKVSRQAEIMRDQVNHYLERARMVARAGAIGHVCDVAPVLEGLQRTLERIYRDKGVAVEVESPADLRFQGEKQDLEEMLGNLMDNACKWASSRTRVVVTAPPPARGARARLMIVVEDDGPGLTDEQRAKIGKRGMRLDETKPGSGLGLSIVTDLATSYGGKLALARADLGGLSATLDLPAA